MRRAEREAAYVDYVTARRDHLRRVAYALCGDWHRADDLLQTALVKLYVAWPRVCRDGREDAYMRQILVRVNIDEHRRPWRREQPVEFVPDVPGASPSGIEERTPLVDALLELPLMQRKTVVLRHWLGMSVQETAFELGISEGTVKSHTSRGLAALRLTMEATRN